MDKQEFENWPAMADEAPGANGPDYVALVIEWDQLPDAEEEQLLAQESERMTEGIMGGITEGMQLEPARAGRAILAGLAALGALLLAGWGIHRLRAS